MLLPILTKSFRKQFVLHEVVQGLVDDYGPRDLGEAELFFEGLGYLENIGYLSETMSLSNPYRMLMVTRAGHAASVSSQGAGSHAARALPSADLLHPEIAATALPEMDRGPDYFQDAIFKAYKAVEINVRNAAKFGNDRIGIPLMNAAFGPGGPLRDPEAEGGEAEAVRSLFAGAVGTFKNPPSHRVVDERDPRQAMRLLAFASVLLEIVDRHTAKY